MARKTTSVPEGDLTPVQHEIMVEVWTGPPAGLTVAEIWQGIAGRRDVARTTVLNLVDRLEKRGWLARASVAGIFRYRATVTRELAESRLATGFITEFFGGSPTQLVQSLLGADEISASDIDRLRDLLAEAKKRKSRGALPRSSEETAR